MGEGTLSPGGQLQDAVRRNGGAAIQEAHAVRIVNRVIPGQCFEQPELELTLMAIDDKMMFDGGSAAKMRELVSAGTFGFGTFQCDDMLATYEELKAKGVHFKKPPAQEFYGFSAVFQDDSGNWFSLSEKPK